MPAALAQDVRAGQRRAPQRLNPHRHPQPLPVLLRPQEQQDQRQVHLGHGGPDQHGVHQGLRGLRQRPDVSQEHPCVHPDEEERPSDRGAIQGCLKKPSLPLFFLSFFLSLSLFPFSCYKG